MQARNNRFLFVDGIRGLAVINMVLFHFLYDIFIVYGHDPGWYGMPAVRIWQQSICRIFIFISGFVWQWGRSGNVKRGIFFNICGGVISLVTLFVLPSETIWFGILNFIGCAVLLMVPIRKAADRIPSGPGLAVSFFLFLVLKNVPHGYIGIGRQLCIPIPGQLYAIKLLTPLGFPFPGFVSSDYFPILPWIFMFLCGYFGQRLLSAKPYWQRIARIKIPFLSDIGQKSIWIYLLHQPVCLTICNLFLVSLKKSI